MPPGHKAAHIPERTLRAFWEKVRAERTQAAPACANLNSYFPVGTVPLSSGDTDEAKKRIIRIVPTTRNVADGIWIQKTGQLAKCDFQSLSESYRPRLPVGWDCAAFGAFVWCRAEVILALGAITCRGLVSNRTAKHEQRDRWEKQ